MSKAVQILHLVAANKSLLKSPLVKFYSQETDERTTEVLEALSSATESEIDFALLITSDVVTTPPPEKTKEPVIEGELLEAEPEAKDLMVEFDDRLDERLEALHDKETVEEARSEEMTNLVSDIDEDLEASIAEVDELMADVIAEEEAERLNRELDPNDPIDALLLDSNGEPEESILGGEVINLSADGTVYDAGSGDPVKEEKEESEDLDDLDLDSLLDDLDG
ncbi:hypothetical protein VCR15J2_390105 [Vibrio coralliirubri]|uniref:hypothetical protein n=1 Tax=Vibrio coralliirubri TaxID=1516159 RepID=UPI00063282E6|nr:hypothetical protein [Vibrio coralliirubri]CDT53831.1 hypothetical protein VCR15J2_390105 [Vibrio coralliirubri]